MAETRKLPSEPFRQVDVEPPSGVAALLFGLESRLSSKLTAVHDRVVALERRASETSDGVTRLERAQESAFSRLDDLAPRVSAVEKPIVRRGLATTARYTAVVALAGALAQFSAARWPEVAGYLKTVGEALSRLAGG